MPGQPRWPAIVTALCVVGAFTLPPLANGQQREGRPPLAMGSVMGTVVDSQGRPVAGATVSFEPGNRQLITDGAGGFRFDGLPGGTQYTVRAAKGEAASLPTSGRIDSRVPYEVRLTLVGETAPAPRPSTKASGRSEETERHVSQLVVMIRGTLGDAGETLGAGIIVGRAQGRMYIATADHVVRGSADTMKDLKVAFKWLPGETTAGEVTADHDRGLDLAVVIIRNPPDLPADQGFAVVGAAPVRKDSVFTVGHPNGKPWFIGAAPDTVVETVGDAIQFQSGFVAPGNSGGALINAQSQLIGLVTQDDPPIARALRIQAALERIRQWRYPIGLSNAP